MNSYIGINHRTLADESHDLTIYRLTILPQVYTDWLTVFHIDITFILRHEIDIAPDFLEVINILGPWTVHWNLAKALWILNFLPGPDLKMMIRWNVSQHSKVSGGCKGAPMAALGRCVVFFFILF